MQNLEGKHPNRPGLEANTSKFLATSGPNEPLYPVISHIDGIEFVCYTRQIIHCVFVLKWYKFGFIYGCVTRTM